MFDIGFSELAVIGVVALVVIGPERLPKVARTAGHLFGRFQRYVSNVKADIAREIELDELRKFKNEFEESARSIHSSIHNEISLIDQEVNVLKDEAMQTHHGQSQDDKPIISNSTEEPESNNSSQLEFPFDNHSKTKSPIRMSSQEAFLSHLVELRSRLIRSLIAVVVIFACLFPFASDIYDILAYPMISTLPEGTKMIATGVVAPFFIPIKITFLLAAVIALPYLFYQAWAFIAPGLYSHEKKLVLPIVLASTLLFFLGMAFCYGFVFKIAFSTIYQFAPKSIAVAPDIENYFNFVLGMFLAFGITFQVPIAVVILVRAGVVSIEKLKEIRRYFIVGAFVVAAIVTPPDVYSQVMLAIPLCILYEVGLIVAKFVVPKERKMITQR